MSRFLQFPHPDFINKKVDIELKKVDIDPQKVDIEPEKVDIEPEKVDIELEKVDIAHQKVDIQELKVNYIKRLKAMGVTKSILEKTDILLGTIELGQIFGRTKVVKNFNRQ